MYRVHPQYIECPILNPSPHLSPIGVSVSFADNVSKHPSDQNVFRIIYTKKTWSEKDKAHFCLMIRPAFKGAEISVNKNWELMEFKLLLGVEQIYFYNHSAPKEFNEMINYYEYKNLLTLIQIYTPIFDQAELNNNRAQHVALLDSIIRTMGNYRFMINADLDEIMVPRVHNSYRGLYNEYLPNRISRRSLFRIQVF